MKSILDQFFYFYLGRILFAVKQYFCIDRRSITVWIIQLNLIVPTWLIKYKNKKTVWFIYYKLFGEHIIILAAQYCTFVLHLINYDDNLHVFYVIFVVPIYYKIVTPIINFIFQYKIHCITVKHVIILSVTWNPRWKNSLFCIQIDNRLINVISV